VIEAEGEIPVGIFALLETGDMEAAQDAVGEIVEVIEDSMYDQEFEKEDIGGVEMQVIVEPYNEEILGGYGFTEQHVVIGFTEEGLETAVDSDITPITDDETFKKVRAQLPSNNAGYFYVNVENVWHLIYDSMPEYGREDFDAETRPYLEPIKAIGAAGAQADPRQGYVGGTLFIYIP